MWGWVEDGVPDYGEKEAAVQVHVWGGFSDLDGFHSSPQPESFSSSLHSGMFLVDVVVGIITMKCSAVLGVSSSHCLSVFTQPCLQCLLGCFHMHLKAILTRDLVHAPVCSCSGVLSASPAQALFSLLRLSGTGQHAAPVVPFVGPDSSFMPLPWTFAALRCRDLAGSSLAKSF